MSHSCWVCLKPLFIIPNPRGFSLVTDTYTCAVATWNKTHQPLYIADQLVKLTHQCHSLPHKKILNRTYHFNLDSHAYESQSVFISFYEREIFISHSFNLLLLRFLFPSTAFVSNHLATLDLWAKQPFLHFIFPNHSCLWRNIGTKQKSIFFFFSSVKLLRLFTLPSPVFVCCFSVYLNFICVCAHV